MTDTTTRIPYCHKIRYGVSGAPEIPIDVPTAPDVTLAPTLVEIRYLAARGEQPAFVDATVSGYWMCGGERWQPEKELAHHFKNGPEGWPAWLAEEARLHAPDAAASAAVVPAADRAAPEPSDPTQCSGEEGFCPEHGFHRHSLKQPGTPEPAADRAALRDRIAAAVQPLLMDTLPKPIAAARADEVADAVLSVLPAPADRAAVLREAADVLAAHPGAIPYRPQLDEDGGFWWDTRDRDAAAELLRRLAAEAAAVDRAAAETPAAPGRCPHGCDVSACPCLACEADQLAAEEAQQPERCAHCGKPVRLITGTLTTWWVHDPGGHTVCNPQHAATSPRAEPGPVVEAQPGKDTETQRPKEA